MWSLKIRDATGAASTTQKSTNPKCRGLEWQGYFLDYFPKVDLIAMIHLGVHVVFRRGTLKSCTWDNTQSSSMAPGEERFHPVGLTVLPLGKKSGVPVHICHWIRLRLRPQHFTLGKKKGWNFKVCKGNILKMKMLRCSWVPHKHSETKKWSSHSKPSEALRISAPTPSPRAVLLV